MHNNICGFQRLFSLTATDAAGPSSRLVCKKSSGRATHCSKMGSHDISMERVAVECGRCTAGCAFCGDGSKQCARFKHCTDQEGCWAWCKPLVPCNHAAGALWAALRTTAMVTAAYAKHDAHCERRGEETRPEERRPAAVQMCSAVQCIPAARCDLHARRGQEWVVS
jgi:hypothetical protein